jgi:hypothetical protein
MMSAFDSAIKAIKSLPRNVWVVTAVSFMTDVSSEMVFNLLPLFLANVLGVRLGIVGLIEGLAETTASIVKMYSGWLSDWLCGPSGQHYRRNSLAGHWRLDRFWSRGTLCFWGSNGFTGRSYSVFPAWNR